MSEVYEKLQRCFETVQKKVTFKPELALVLEADWAISATQWT